MLRFQKSFILSLMMAFTVCGLQAFDAPAYACCQDIGVCEFLDLVGIMGESAESHITPMRGGYDLSPIHASSNMAKLSLPDLSAYLSVRKKRYYLDFSDYFFIRYQVPRPGVLDFLDTHWIKTATSSARYHFDSKDHNPPSPTLQMVAISVIQS